jgi:hypothetical protein
LFAETRLAVNEERLLFDAIKDSLDLHPGVPFALFDWSLTEHNEGPGMGHIWREVPSIRSIDDSSDRDAGRSRFFGVVERGTENTLTDRRRDQITFDRSNGGCLAPDVTHTFWRRAQSSKFKVQSDVDRVDVVD